MIGYLAKYATMKKAKKSKTVTEPADYAARAKILKEGRYYYTFYPNGIQGSMSLKGAYAVIYDRRMKSLYKVPITKTAGKGVEGATIYLKGLEINRKIIKG